MFYESYLDMGIIASYLAIFNLSFNIFLFSVYLFGFQSNRQ